MMERIILWTALLLVLFSLVGGCCMWRYVDEEGEDETYLRYYDLMPRNEVQFNN